MSVCFKSGLCVLGFQGSGCGVEASNAFRILACGSFPLMEDLLHHLRCQKCVNTSFTPQTLDPKLFTVVQVFSYQPYAGTVLFGDALVPKNRVRLHLPFVFVGVALYIKHTVLLGSTTEEVLLTWEFPSRSAQTEEHSFCGV